MAQTSGIVVKRVAGSEPGAERSGHEGQTVVRPLGRIVLRPIPGEHHGVSATAGSPLHLVRLIDTARAASYPWDVRRETAGFRFPALGVVTVKAVIDGRWRRAPRRQDRRSWKGLVVRTTASLHGVTTGDGSRGRVVPGCRWLAQLHSAGTGSGLSQSVEQQRVDTADEVTGAGPVPSRRPSQGNCSEAASSSGPTRWAYGPF